MKRIFLIIVLLIIALIPGACGSPSDEELIPVTFILDWVPNTNHTGIFVAEAKDYFIEAGLAVKIIQPGEVYPEAAVASGAADFGISFQEYVTLARAGEVPIVSIAAVLQHNTSGFASAANLNVTSPADFQGLRYGSFGTPFEAPTLEVLMNCAGGDFSQLEIVNTGWADPLALISERQIDMAWIFYGWQGFQAQQQGVDLNIVMMKDYFDCIPDYYTPVVIASEDIIASKPEVVKAFMEALTRGYNFAIQNPDEAAELLLAAVPELNTELVKASQHWLSEYYQADASRWGEQKESVWQDYTDWMVVHGILSAPISVSDAFSNEFLP
ncbi:MAG: ABC transporter substrate-binding protein [Sedimentisphaerales bacterium]|nr:ABC transporter substrate-binding protein [Sedimentisphaerales bacterium]